MSAAVPTADPPLAVITGAASGIGRGLAEGFRAAGHRVIGLDRAPASLQGEGYEHRILDMTDAAAVAAFGAGLDRLAVLINAAGIIRRREEFAPEAFEAVIDVNLAGVMRMCAACRPALAAAGGAVVNLASMFSFFGAGHAPAYAAAKGGVAQLTKSLAVAWAKEGIRVNAIAPGWIETGITAPLVADPERSRQILERTPMGRWGRPEDLVGPALFLAGPAASFVTGAVLTVDGGYSVM